MIGGDSWFDRQVSPSFLLLAGMLLAPAVILQQNLLIKSVQTVLFLLLALYSIVGGKRRLVIGSMVFAATTVIANLLSPVGRVLCTVGPLRITQGALFVGISKATTVVSLLYLSRLCVRPSVHLPGVFGGCLSQSLVYLNRLLARRERIRRGNMVGRLDGLFQSVMDAEQVDGEQQGPRIRTTVIGALALAALLVVNWGALFFPFSTLLGAG